MSTYFEDLAGRLRAAGVPAERAASMIDELSAYLALAGTDAEDEFGPADAFAEQLTASAHGDTSDAPVPSEADESWAFHADVFNEMALLGKFGDQGWEVVSYDIVTGFDCRRSLENPQRWEYRREAVPPKRLTAVRSRLAEDGWEVAATYGFWHYFKRPVAAITGPAAELEAPPAMPRRKFYWSRTFAASIGVYFVVLVVLGVLVGLYLTGSDSDSGSDSGSLLATVSGAVVGIALVVGFFTAAILYHRHKATRR